MEGQHAVAEAVHLLDHQHAHDLLGAQSPCPTSHLLGVATGAQVLQDELLDSRMVVEEPRDDLQLDGMVETEPGLAQAGLSFLGFAHSGWPLFSA
jgi:hypothetical protein